MAGGPHPVTDPSPTSQPADHADDPGEVVVGIETDRGLWVQALIAAGYTVYAINPLSVSRYRDRHNVAGAKSDPGDAKVLADLVRAAPTTTTTEQSLATAITPTA